MDAAREQEIVEYLAGLPEGDRDDAYQRINAGIALEAPVDEVDPLKPKFVLFGQYREQEFDTPPFLVSSGQVVRGEITALVARAGKGKTTLVRNRMIRWAAGLPLFDELKFSQVPEHPLKTLLIENEGVGWDMQNKLNGIAAAEGFSPEAEEALNENLAIWGDGGYSDLKIDNDEDYKLIDHNVGLLKPDVVVLEPFRGLWRGEENDSTAMEATLDRMVAMATRHGCAILLSHHERKSGAGEDGEWMSAARGSGVLEGKVAVMENFRAVKDGAQRELSWSKSRYFPTQGPVRMEYDEDSHRYNMVPENEVAQEIKALLTQQESWFTVGELSEELGETQTKIRSGLNDLLDSDSIMKKKHENGFRYRLRSAPSAGDPDNEERLDMS